MAIPRRTRLAALASATVLGVGAVLGSAPAASAARTEPELAAARTAPGLDERTAARVDWQPCADAPGVQCGSITVPIDWSEPGKGSVNIALARRPATDPARRIGALLINPGGPGGSGVNVIKQDSMLSADVQRQFDIVGFDPRGVGASNPILCPAVPWLPAPAEFPTTPETFAALKMFNQAYVQDCRRLTGPLFDYVDTLSVVQDMDAIRAALGERKLNYYGVSYGTLIGQQYAQRYPNRIRTMVLDSNMDHSITTAWRFMRTEATGAEESFDEFVAWCQRSTECALHGQDVRKMFRELRAKAERGEVTYPGTDITLTPLVFLWVVMRMLYGPEWNELAQLLVVLRAGGPVPAGLATSVPELLPTTGSADTVTLPASPTGSTEVAIRDATLIICQDWRLPVRSAAELAIYRQALTLVAPDMTLSPLGWLVPVACAGLDNLHRNPQAPLRFTGSPSILMLTSRYDPSTPYEWTMAAAQQSGVRVLQYDGWGHGVYFKGSACSIAATDNYLITTRRPAAGTHCPAVEPTDGALRRGPVAPPTIRMWS